MDNRHRIEALVSGENAVGRGAGLNFNQQGLSGVDVTYGRTTEFKSGKTTYNSGLTGGLGCNIQNQTTDLIVGASASAEDLHPGMKIPIAKATAEHNQRHGNERWS